MRHLVAPQNALRDWKPHLPNKIPILLALASLALFAATAFAANPDPAWQPSPDMIGTFRAVIDDNLLIIAPDGHCEFSTPSMEFSSVGSIRPDPAGESNRFLAELRSVPTPGSEDASDTATLLFSYAPADRAWQMLSMMVDGNCDVLSLEEESTMTVDGVVEHDDKWFQFHFVPDPASFDWSAASDTARRHFTGTWKNLGDGDGATMVLSPDGTGTIENKNMASTETCTWSVFRHENGWQIVCQIVERGAPPVPSERYFALLEPDDQFQRLRLLNVTRHFALAMASDGHESLSASNPTYFDRIADTPPAE